MNSSATEKDTITTPDTNLGSAVQGKASEDVLNRVITKTSPSLNSPETSFTPINKAAADGDNTSVTSASTVDRDVDKADNAFKRSIVDSGDAKDMDGRDGVKKPTVNSSGKSIGKPIGKEETMEKTKTIVKEPAENPVEKGKTVVKEPAEKPAEKPASKKDPVTSDKVSVSVTGPKRKTTSTKEGGAAKPANGNAKKSTSSAKAAGKKEPQILIPPKKSPAVPANTGVLTTPTTQKRPAPEIPITPEKQVHVDLINGSSSSHSKRPKFIPTPLAATPTTIMPRLPPGISSPRLISVERKVAEQRKKLEAIRQMRLETAKKQEALDKKMEPYKKRMEEELERLNREMMEEEAAAAEDEEHFKASEEMLKEFEMGE